MSKRLISVHFTDDEVEHAVDYGMRSLCIGLKKHPEEGIDGGIFTRCVKYCEENDAAYSLSNVCELATDLQAGRTPRLPAPSKIRGVVGQFGPRQDTQDVEETRE